MDRNWIPCGNAGIGSPVALRKESVDRNKSPLINCNSNFTSLSARRAWIEIPDHQALKQYQASLSARRAWIEIPMTRRAILVFLVALRKESVDRNKSSWPPSCRIPTSLSARRAWIEIRIGGVQTMAIYSRSPQGERG